MDYKIYIISFSNRDNKNMAIFYNFKKAKTNFGYIRPIDVNKSHILFIALTIFNYWVSETSDNKVIKSLSWL